MTSFLNWCAQHFWPIFWICFLFGSSIAAALHKVISAPFKAMAKVISAPFKAMAKRERNRQAHELALRKLELKAAFPVHQEEDAPPGPCQHYRVTPVVSDDEVVAWLCKNPECLEKLPANYAVRAEDLPKGKTRRTE